MVVAAQNSLGDRLTLDDAEIQAAQDHEVVFHRDLVSGEIIVAAYCEHTHRTVDPAVPDAIFDFDRYEDVEDEAEYVDPF